MSRLTIRDRAPIVVVDAAQSMMIKKIILDNFMSHAHTVIEPADGLTVLVGPNNCGKSAVVEALRAVCENTRGGHFVVRHGAKEATVTIETDDGHIISWQRRAKSSSYTIDGVRNDRPESDFLDKVHRLLKLPKVKASESNEEFDVHFGEQKSPIFLLNQTGASAATFFASSSDAERLLQMQRLHRTKIADDKKEEGKRAANLAKLDCQLATLSPLDVIDLDLATTSDCFSQITANLAKTHQVQEMNVRLAQTSRRLARHRADADAAQSLSAPPVLKDEESIDRLIRRYKGALLRHELARREAAALATITAPPVLADERGHENHCQRRRMLEIRLRRLSAISGHISDLRPPPVAAETSSLSDRIASFRRVITARDRAAARRERSAQLAEPPSMLDWQPVADRMARLRNAQAALAQLRMHLRTALNQLDQAQCSIQDWASQNPICPVCNGTVDPSRLLTSAGAHDHG